MNFHVLREKVEKSCNRTPGWVSRRAAKVLCLIRVWGGYLRPGVEFSPISPFWWKWAEFHHISWKFGDFTPFSAPWGGNGAWAAPERKHQRNLCFSYAFLGVLGSKMRFGVDFHPKPPFRVLFWWKSPKWVEFRGISPFSLNSQHFGVPRGPGPPEGMEFTCIIRGFARSAGSRRKCWFYTFYQDFWHSRGKSHIFMNFSYFVIFHENTWNSWTCVYSPARAPK